MKLAALFGPSHVTRWMDDIARGRLPAPPGVFLWGEAGLPIFSKRLTANIHRHISRDREIWLMVPDFRFGNKFFAAHENFEQTGPLLDGYCAIDKSLITARRDQILYNHAVAILDGLVAAHGTKIKLMFWCLAVREERNRRAGKYVDERGHYCHPLWNYSDLIRRYKNNSVDVSLILRDLDSYTLDQQGHPSLKGNVFICNAFRMGGDSAYLETEKSYREAQTALFQLDANSNYMIDNKVHHGVGGNLFLGSDSNHELQQMSGALTWTTSQSSAFDALLTHRRTRLNAIGCKHIILIAPNKSTVQFEAIPAPAPSLTRPVVELARLCRGHEIDLIYPVEQLRTASDLPTYSQTDTHWTDYGGFLAFKEVMKAASRLGVGENVLKDRDVQFEMRYLRGDLGIKVTPERRSLTAVSAISAQKSKLVFYNGITNRGAIKIYENSSAPKLKLMIFGDSFHLGVIRYFAESYSRVMFIHRSDLDYELIEREEPDLVLFELAERFLIRPPSEQDIRSTCDLVLAKLRQGKADGVISIDAQQIDALMHKALQAIASGQYVNAEVLLRSVMEKEPAWQTPRAYHVRCLFAMGDYRSAEEYSRKCDPDRILDENFSSDLTEQSTCAIGSWFYARHLLAQELLRNKRFSEAETHQLVAARDCPTSWRVAVQYAHILMGLGRYAKALEWFLRATTICPRNAYVLAAAGLAHFKLNSPEASFESYSSAIAINPHISEWHLMKGVALLKLGNLPGALDAIDESLRLDPHFDRALVQKAVVLRKLDRLREAESYLRQALVVNPENLSAAQELHRLLPPSNNKQGQ